MVPKEVGDGQAGREKELIEKGRERVRDGERERGREGGFQVLAVK